MSGSLATSNSASGNAASLQQVAEANARAERQRTTNHTVGGIVIGLILLGLAVYFMPTIVAMLAGHQNTLAIFILNLFLGWTLVGWVIALVWACSKTA